MTARIYHEHTPEIPVALRSTINENVKKQLWSQPLADVKSWSTWMRELIVHLLVKFEGTDISFTWKFTTNNSELITYLIQFEGTAILSTWKLISNNSEWFTYKRPFQTGNKYVLSTQ